MIQVLLPNVQSQVDQEDKVKSRKAFRDWYATYREDLMT